MDSTRAEDRLQIVNYLDGIRERLKAQGLDVDSRILESGDAASRILELVDQEPVDIIVLTSHGRTGAARFLLGSCAEKVARHAGCPVLIVRRNP